MLDWLRRAPGFVPGGSHDVPLIDLGARSVPVIVRRLAHARRMTLRLAPDGSEVRISIPRWGRTAEALAFAEARRDWLARQLDALPAAAPLAHGGGLPLRGAMLTIHHDPRARRTPQVIGSALHVGGPEEGLPPRLRRWLEKQARALVAEDLAHYCTVAGQQVPALALSNAQRRWGSCSASGTVRINWRLVMAPDAVRRSVVAHEVAHLIHFDHSPRFHALLGEIFEGDIAAANLWLKREGRGLYALFG